MVGWTQIGLGSMDFRVATGHHACFSDGSFALFQPNLLERKPDLASIQVNFDHLWSTVVNVATAW